MSIQRLLSALVVSLLFEQTATAQGLPLAEWEIHDSLGRHWRQEMLHYDVELAKPVERGQDFALTADGKPAPVQVIERRLDKAGMVHAVRIALITDLQPFQQRQFQLHAAAPTASPGDVRVAKEGQRLLLTTSKIGVALPLGEAKNAGQPISEVPAPILRIRCPNADWVGKGWFTGKKKVMSWKSELLASGPVFAWAKVSYDFGDGENYVVDIRVPAGQEVVLVREERILSKVTAYETDPAKGNVFQLALAPGLKPTHVYSKRGLGSSGYFIEPGPGFKGSYLTPAQMHYIPAACNIAGTWRESDDKAPFIGLFPRFLSQWNRPHQTFVPLVWDKEQGLVARFFLNHGNREWALMAGNKKDMLTPRGQGGEAIGGYYDALLLANKWGATPLDKVKNWVLDWGEFRYKPSGKYSPAPPVRGNMPYFAEQFLSGGHMWHDTYIHVHQTWTGEGDAWEQYHQALPKVPAEQQLSYRAAAAFVQYKQTDPDYWPEGNWIGPANPNMIHAGNSAILKGAIALAGHPKAKDWAARGIAKVRDNLEQSTSADGAWIECPGYEGAGALMLAALDLKRSGLGDLFADGRLLKVAMYHADLVTPPDPRVNNVRHLPEYGDCFDLRTDKFAERARPMYWKKMAPVLKKSHPKELGQILWALGEKQGPVTIVPIDGKSRHIEGFGAVYRHAFNTPDESYLAIHQDSFGFGHYHFDLGHLYFFGLGAPLCVDWPSLYSPQINQPWMHNCVSVARMPRYSYKGRVVHGALTPAADYSRARVYYDAKFPPKPGDANDDVPPHCWQRQVVFVKRPNNVAYLVVRDAVDDDRPTDWNLWTLSNKLRLEKGRAVATGRYGVDMTVGFFIGAEQTPTTEMFGFGNSPVANAPGLPDIRKVKLASGGIEVEVPRRHLMQQNVIRMASSKGGQYGAVIFPHRPMGKAPTITPGPEGTVMILSDGVEDLVFAYPNPRKITLGKVTFEGRAGIVTRSNGQVRLHLLDGKKLSVAGAPEARGD